MNLLKLIYNDPRPFWVSDKVSPFKCSVQYGNPSGHTMIGFMMLLMPWLDYNSNYRNGETLLGKLVTKVGILISFLVLGGLVAYSRLYLGVHSLDQVLLGFLLSLWLSLTAHYLLKRPMMTHFDELLNGTKTNFTLLLSLSSVTFIVLFSILILLAELIDPAND